MKLCYYLIMQSLLRRLDNFNKELNSLNFDKDYIIYNPLNYARKMHEDYLFLSSNHNASILFIGMNPGPFGMMQNGIPFGSASNVKNYLKIENNVNSFSLHEKHKIVGLDLKRDEVSGKKLWTLMENLYSNCNDLFKKITIQNYCPLAFLDEGGKNIALDKLAKNDRLKVEKLCDDYLKFYIEHFNIKTCIGVGNYAYSKLENLDLNLKIAKILHPSPLNPQSHKDWDIKVIEALRLEGIQL